MIAMNDIQEFVNQVATLFEPEQIILFGSYATGSPNEDSDLDLLVIMPFEGKPWQAASRIREKVRPRFPLDLLVRTPAMIRQRMAMNDVFLKDILQNGRVLYEAGNHRVG